MITRVAAISAAILLAACTETGRQAPATSTPAVAAPTPAASQRMPSKNEQACLAAVSRETSNGDVILLGTEESQANDFVRIGVGPQRAPWKCLVKDGRVAEVSSMKPDGKL